MTSPTTIEGADSGWTPLTDDIAAFLDDFDLRGRHVDTDDSQAGVFASTFLALDPHRALALTPEQLAAVLPARRRMFAEAGVTELVRVAAWQLRLDERHVLVRADWQAHRPGGQIVLATTFLLRREGGGYEIVVYLNHTDLARQLAANGSTA
ncbi:hypothetical protein J5X84_28185 [Streptosporangiaceae bacterium NEAU-GS5]|nr:hypothetical protein [Streptosporangiaceae bacterium NEAU-GS5]